MTFLSRRKRPTIRRATTRSAATAIKLAVWAVLAVAGRAPAQSSLPAPVKLPGLNASPLHENQSRPGQTVPAAYPAAAQGNEGGAYYPPGGKGVILRTGAQLSGRPKAGDEEIDFAIQTDLPGPDRLFRRESEPQLQERMRQEARKRSSTGGIVFPEYTPLAKDPLAPRDFPDTTYVIEPLYVNHCRLFFEQPNTERHGWDLGVLTPVVNLGAFYYDTLLFPYHFWSRPCDCGETSAGKCLPGDPTPFLLYREQFSWTGLLGQAGAVAGGIVIFP